MNYWQKPNPSASFSLLIGISALALSGCEDFTPVDDDRATDAAELLDSISELDPTPAASMPTSGSATYNGYVTGEIGVSGTITDVVLADTTLVASFTGVGGSISGTIDNFESSQSADISGSQLILSGGTIASNAFTANVDGVLGYDDDTVTVDATLVGGFLGDDADAVLGDIAGSTDVSTGYSGKTDMVLFAEQ